MHGEPPGPGRYDVDAAATIAADSARTTLLPRGHVPELDGLRGIAILLVIVSHYLGDYWPVASVGWTGVSLFFVLSGYLITGILLDAKTGPYYFRNFYARRTLRIFPLYYLVLFLIFVVGPLIPSLDSEEFRNLARHQVWLWTYTMNIYTAFNAVIGTNLFAGGWVEVLHFWSLCVEEQFYLVWPLIVLLTTRRQLIGVCVICVAGALTLRAYFATEQYNPEPYFFTLCRIDDLAAGAFIAAIARGRGGLERLAACASWTAILALWVLLGVGMEVGHFFQLDARVQTWGYWAFGVLYASLVVFALTTRMHGTFRWILRNTVLRSYGQYSYAIYIFHWGLSPLLFARIAPLETMTEQFGSQTAALAVRVIIVAIVSWGIGWISWHVYEKHFLKLKRFFYSNPPTDLHRFTQTSSTENGLHKG